MDLIIKDITDWYIRENFKRLKSFAENLIIESAQWKFYELTFTATVTNLKYAHRLGYQPKDILQTSLIGTGTVAFNYSLFDATNFDLTIGGTASTAVPTIVRFFAGSYKEGSTL